MDKAFPLYAADNTLDEYYALKPDLNETQWQLIDAFYRARRETATHSRVTVVEFERHVLNVNLDSDIAIHILQKIDDEYLSLEAEKMKRKNRG